MSGDRPHAADTTSIRPEEAFDEAVVADYLRAHLGELVGDAEIFFDQFPGGRANLTYRAVAGDTELVLRRAPLGPVARGGHDMAREHRVLSHLWRAFPPAPRAYLYCPDPEVMGKPFFVMERRRGHVVRDRWPESWRPGDDAIRRSTSVAVVDALARLHLVDPEAVGLADLGRPDGFVRRQVEGWAARWEAARTRRVLEMTSVERLLRGGVPVPQAATVLHNDYKLDNVMVSDDGEVVAVFDWDMATLGDPLVDLGTLLAYWTDRDGPTFPVFGRDAVTLAPYLDRSEVVARYAQQTGFDVSDVRFYEGLALYRIAIIIEQIFARFASGQTSDERFADLEPLPPLLAVAALDVLEGPR
jgi:aminoglycoside phosphotransferase (APT) family kinase protein